MNTRILNSKTMLFLFFAFTVCISQEKTIYFSYDSPVNVTFTVYNERERGEAIINGRKIVGKIEYEEHVANEGLPNERYIDYIVFYENQSTLCKDGIIFIFQFEEDDKSVRFLDFKCRTLLGSNGEVGDLYLINQPGNIKLLDQYDGYRVMNDIPLMNDKAYYLEQAGAYAESIYILKKVISKSPDRVVAYLNIADAYWGNNEREEAKKSYEKYVELMKKQGKDTKKIPQRVYDRIKAVK